MHRSFLSAGTIFGAIAIVLGAFGAHALKKIVPPDSVNTFQTGVQYQMYHSLALILVAIIFERFPNKWTRLAGIFFIAGVILFSGSLYILTLLKATGTVGLNGVGIVTPFGGLFFIGGWLFLFAGVRKKN